MQVFILQWDLAWEQPERNLQIVRSFLANTPTPQGALVVLPETAAAGFTMNLPGCALPPGSNWEKELARIAAERGVAIIAGVARNHGGQCANEALFIDPSGVRGCYRKMRPFTGAGEHAAMPAGDQVAIFDWQGARVCPLICYDLRFPEVFRLAALEGVDVFVVIASWPSVRRQHWITLLQARAIENIACVVGVNRTGADPFHQYAGDSLIVDHMGKIIADAGDKDGVVSGQLDLAAMRQWRETFPALRDLHRFPQLVRPAAP